MQAWIRLVGFACGAMFAVACGSKGDADPATGGTGGGNPGTGATGGGGSGGSAGEASGGTGGGTGGSNGGTGGSSQTCRTAPTGDETTTVSFDTDEVICSGATCSSMNEVWKVTYTSADEPNGRVPIPVDMVGLSWSETEGDPDPGALQVEIPYETPGQYVGVGINFTTAQDLTEKVITARVKVSGLGDATELMTNPGGVKIYAKSGSGYVYAAGVFTNVGDQPHPLDTWFTVPFDLRPTATSVTGCFSYIDEMNDAGTFNPAEVLEIGLQFDTGGMQMTVMPATVLVDSIAW